MALEPELIAITQRVAAALRSAARTLSAELTRQVVEDCLMRWGMVLSVLAADTLDGTVSLLVGGNQRAANMLARAMADYNVRLRYYYVQALPRIRALKQYPHKREHILSEVHALRDWSNSQAKHARILGQYDPSTWTDASREAILAARATPEHDEESRFGEMCRYLKQHEADARGVPPMFQGRLAWSYKHYHPQWRMQSAYLHGDQVVVSEVIEFSATGEPTGNIHMEAPYDARPTILFTALDHGTELLRSMAFVRPVGWIENEWALRDDVATLFLSNVRD